MISPVSTSMRLCSKFFLLFLVAITATAWSSGEEGLPDETTIRVISHTEQAVTIEVKTAKASFESVRYAGDDYQRVVMAGTAQTLDPGRPQLPTIGTFVAVPATGEVSVSVVDADFETVHGVPLIPAPTVSWVEDEGNRFGSGKLTERIALDSALAEWDSLYPVEPVTVARSGLVRDLPVARLQFFPVQTNPVSGDTRVYRRIVVEVTWSSQLSALHTAAGAATQSYATLLQEAVVNYDFVRPIAASGTQTQATQVVSTPYVAAPIASRPTIKIGIEQDGLYRLTYADLIGAGFDFAAIDPRYLRLKNRGSEIALYVSGEADGTLDPADYLLFYAQANRDAFTTRNVYWLDISVEQGLRMADRNVRPRSAAPLFDMFRRRRHIEEDTVYWQNMPGRQGEDRWYWYSRISPNSDGLPAYRDYVLDLDAVAVTDQKATLRARLKGYSGLQHRTQLVLNGVVVDEQSWEGQNMFEHQVQVDHTLLKQDENMVRIVTLDSGASPDQILTNWFEVDYQHAYEARDDRLFYSAPAAGTHAYRITGFSENSALLFDISDVGRPIRLLGAMASIEGGRTILELEDTAQLNSRFLALAPSRILKPAEVIAAYPSNWRSAENGADYVIITHADFMAAADRLAEYRRGQGLRVVVVDVQDLYDEFNAGIFGPIAIRRFLANAYEAWQAPAPSYVLLIGDAYQDYKDNLKTGTPNFVPSQNIESSLFGEVSSDNWYVTVAGDDILPDMLIGRLSVQSAREADIVVGKIIDYEREPSNASWRKQILLVADDDDFLFQSLSNTLANRVPDTFDVTQVNVVTYPPGDPRQEIVAKINEGLGLVNYSGHGEYFGWGRWDDEQQPILDVSDVNGLWNGGKLPFVSVANCLNGFFAGPKENEALAETWQRLEAGGAIAVWAPTGYGYAAGHRVLLDELYRQFFQLEQQELGAATAAAKMTAFQQSGLWAELVQTYVLFGDPATSLRLPGVAPGVAGTSPAHQANGVLLDQPIKIQFDKAVAPDQVVLTSALDDLQFKPTWDADFTAVSYDHLLLTANATYELSVTARDKAGRKLHAGGAPNPWTFTTVADGEAPTAVIGVPSDNGNPNFTTSQLTIRFSEPVREESVRYVVSPSVSGRLIWDKEGLTAKYEHARFEQERQYTFMLLAATDIAGNTLQAPLLRTFTVATTEEINLPLFLLQVD